MPHASVNGIGLHYRREGSGEPLLLLAGMMSDGASWQPVELGLARHAELIIPDNRCTGQTTPMPVASSCETMLDDVLALLDHLGIERVRVLGHSMGGLLGWHLATRAPDRVSLLITAAAIHRVIPARIDLFRTLARLRRQTDPSLWYRQLFHWLFSPRFFDDHDATRQAIQSALDYPFQQSVDALDQQVLALESFLPPPDLSQLRCTVHGIGASNDLLLPPVALETTLEALRQSRTGLQERIHAPHIIQNAAHALHWEQPEAFVEQVVACLTSP